SGLSVIYRIHDGWACGWFQRMEGGSLSSFHAISRPQVSLE
ncbi:MAG: hypothetical protein RIS70_4376, partial [Planctomycetota bacterium]